MASEQEEEFAAAVRRAEAALGPAASGSNVMRAAPEPERE